MQLNEVASRISKKIIYVTNTRFPTERAHGLATVKLCEALATENWDVEIIAPYLWKKRQDDVFKYYNVGKVFKIKKILTIDLFSLRFFPFLTFLIQIFSFSLFALFYILFKYRKELDKIVFFSHDYIPLYFLSFFSKKIFYDVHHFPGNNFLYKRVMKKSFGFAVQTRWKVKALKEQFGIGAEKIVYWPNGTDIEKFIINVDQIEARNKIDLPRNKKIVLYTGQLFGWKGVDTLIRVIKFLDKDTYIYLVGGAENDIKKLKKEIREANDNRIIFFPFQHHELMPFWMKAADVLVLPNTAKQKVSLYYTSPMKLFEYMASGRPIVASNIPSLTEILNKKNAFIAEADNPHSFAQKINYALEFPNPALSLAQQAQRDVRKYSWKNRAKKISTYLMA